MRMRFPKIWSVRLRNISVRPFEKVSCVQWCTRVEGPGGFWMFSWKRVLFFGFWRVRCWINFEFYCIFILFENVSGRVRFNPFPLILQPPCVNLFDVWFLPEKRQIEKGLLFNQCQLFVGLFVPLFSFLPFTFLWEGWHTDVHRGCGQDMGGQ